MKLQFLILLTLLMSNHVFAKLDARDPQSNLRPRWKCIFDVGLNPPRFNVGCFKNYNADKGTGNLLIKNAEYQRSYSKLEDALRDAIITEDVKNQAKVFFNNLEDNSAELGRPKWRCGIRLKLWPIGIGVGCWEVSSYKTANPNEGQGKLVYENFLTTVEQINNDKYLTKEQKVEASELLKTELAKQNRK